MSNMYKFTLGDLYAGALVAYDAERDPHGTTPQWAGRVMRVVGPAGDGVSVVLEDGENGALYSVSPSILKWATPETFWTVLHVPPPGANPSSQWGFETYTSQARARAAYKYLSSSKTKVGWSFTLSGPHTVKPILQCKIESSGGKA